MNSAADWFADQEMRERTRKEHRPMNDEDGWHDFYTEEPDNGRLIYAAFWDINPTITTGYYNSNTKTSEYPTRTVEVRTYRFIFRGVYTDIPAIIGTVFWKYVINENVYPAFPFELFNDGGDPHDER